MGYYPASSGDFLQTLPENLSVPSSVVIFTPEFGTERLFRNFEITTTLYVITQKSAVLENSSM
jgi:hypothetical protein